MGFEEFKGFLIRTPEHCILNTGQGNLKTDRTTTQGFAIIKYLFQLGFSLNSAIAVAVNIQYNSFSSCGLPIDTTSVYNKNGDGDFGYIIHSDYINGNIVRFIPYSQQYVVSDFEDFEIFSNPSLDVGTFGGEFVDNFINDPFYNRDDLQLDWDRTIATYGFLQNFPASTYINNLKAFNPGVQWRNNGGLQLEYFNQSGQSYWGIVDPYINYPYSFLEFKNGKTSSVSDEQFVLDINIPMSLLTKIKSLKTSMYDTNGYEFNKNLAMLTIGFRSKYMNGINTYQYGELYKNQTFDYIPDGVKAELISYAHWLYINCPTMPRRKVDSTKNLAMNNKRKKTIIFLK